MAVCESNMAEFKMAAIIKLSQNEWVKFFYVEMVVTNLGKCEWVWEDKLRGLNPRWQIQDCRIEEGCHHQVKWEWMSLRQIELVWVRVRVEWECFWVNLKEDNNVSESKMAVSESNMAEFKMATIIKFSQNEWVCVRFESEFVQNGCIQDGRIEEGCHHLVNQIELVWVRVRVKWECFSMNLREDNKMSESKMASNMAEFKMAAIIKLSENEWVWVRLN